MQILVNKKLSTEIDTSVFAKILNIYPEEKLGERDIFKLAKLKDSLEFKDLQSECEKILIPWQYFLLDLERLSDEIEKIEALRAGKLSNKFFSKRQGEGEVTSKRIIDRLIRCQNFLSEEYIEIDNKFIGILKRETAENAANKIIEYFEFSTLEFRKFNKREAFLYLVNCLEKKNINICQGVFDNNKILPILSNCKEIYRNTSGFVIKDNKIPFIFLPSEINPNERVGRQIYTLIYLTVLIGLDNYDFLIKKDMSAESLDTDEEEEFVHNIVSYFLIPKVVTDQLLGSKITEAIRDEIAQKFKLTATAVVVILRKRGIINYDEYINLQPELVLPILSKKGMGQPVNYSIKKFNGSHTVQGINHAFKAGSLTSVQAQYLLFGRVNKKAFREYIITNRL